MNRNRAFLKLYLVIPFIIGITPVKLFSQNINRDSLRKAAFSRDSIRQDSIVEKDKIKANARWDARKQKLNPIQLQLFKVDKKNSTSDFFKPQKKFVSDTALLSDSVYVKAFRQAAYERAIYGNSKIPKCIWGSFGMGVSAGTSGGGNVAINGNIEIPLGQLITLEGRTAPSYPLGISINSFGVLYGIIFKQEYSFFTISVGITEVIVDNTFEDTSPSNSWFKPDITTRVTTIGVPILLQYYAVVGRHQHFGFGVSVFANINSAQTLAGINLSLGFGRLSTHERRNKTN